MGDNLKQAKGAPSPRGDAAPARAGSGAGPPPSDDRRGRALAPAVARPPAPGPAPLLRVGRRRRFLLGPAVLLLLAAGPAFWGWRGWIQAIPVEVARPWHGPALEAV